MLSNWMENHPDAFWRTVAQAEIARRRNDLSGAYQQLKRAREIASTDVRSIAENLAGALLLNLQLLNEAEREGRFVSGAFALRGPTRWVRNYRGESMIRFVPRRARRG